MYFSRDDRLCKQFFTVFEENLQKILIAGNTSVNGGDSMRDEFLKKTVLYGLCAAIVAAAVWLALKYALPVLLPFAVAYLLSCGVRPMAKWLHKKTKIPCGVLAAVAIVLFAALLTYLAYLSMSVLIRESVGAVSWVLELLKTEGNPVSCLIDKLTQAVRGFDFGTGADAGRAVTDMVSSAAAAVSSWAAQAAGSVLAKAPACFFSVFVGLISLFYFSMDISGIEREAKRFISANAAEKIAAGLSVVKRALARFARAYLVLLVVTFAELLIGFTVIGVDYAFLAAIITAVIDILPVLGVGTVLVPWAAVLFFSGDTSAALSMLVLLAIMYVVRQIIEPKIVGNSAGVHPVVALVSVYAGYRIAGLGGMIAAPIILNALSVLWEEKAFAKEKSKVKS